MSKPGAQRFLALALEVGFNFPDVGQVGAAIVLVRPQGDVFRGQRLQVGAAELDDLRDLLEDVVPLGVAAGQPLAGDDRRRRVGLLGCKSHRGRTQHDGSQQEGPQQVTQNEHGIASFL